MPNFDEAIRLTEKLFALEKTEREKDARLQKALSELEVFKAQNKSMQNTIEELSRKNEEHYKKWTIENIMRKIRTKKTHILITVYIILLVTELFFYVPYHSIQIFRTQQYKPYTEIVGSGYASMEHIESNKVEWMKNGYTSYVGKRVNTPQLFMNVSVTTVLAIGIYFLIQKKEKKIIEENIPIPVLDINALAFATEEEVAKAQEEYARQMVEYIKGNEII